MLRKLDKCIGRSVNLINGKNPKSKQFRYKGVNKNKNSPSLSSPQTTHRKRSFTFVVIVINLHLNQTPIYLVGSRNVSLAQYVNSKL